LKLGRCPRFLAAPSRLYLDHSHCLVLAPATLAALPSTRAIPDRDVFYVGNPFPRFLRSRFESLAVAQFTCRGGHPLQPD